jgi:hypothetical protein
LTHYRRYGSGEIERDDLNPLVAGVLRGFPGLLDKFDGFLEGDKSLGTTTKKRKRSKDYLSDEPKFSNCRRATPGRITYRKNHLKESPRNQSQFTKQILLLIGFQERRNN